MATKIHHHDYRPREAFNRGKPLWFESIWYLVKCAFFLSALPWPSKLRCALLRRFGATIGTNVYVKPRVNVHFPWRLTIGDHCLVGEEAFILNFEQITIGSQCCISQRAFLCTGNHDFQDPLFPYRNAPITLGDGVWVGAQAFVGPGVTLGDEAVITAGSIVTKSLPPRMVCAGNPCIPLKPRWKDVA